MAWSTRLPKSLRPTLFRICRASRRWIARPSNTSWPALAPASRATLTRSRIRSRRATWSSTASPDYQAGLPCGYHPLADPSVRVHHRAKSTSTVRSQVGLALKQAEPTHLMSGLLVDGVPDWPQDAFAIGTEGEIQFFVFPQGG